MSGFRVTLHLDKFFNDHRKVSKIFVANKLSTVQDLEQHIMHIFGIANFYLQLNDAYLPPTEDIQVINKNDDIAAVPLAKEINKFFTSTQCLSTSTEKEQQVNGTEAKKQNDDSDVNSFLQSLSVKKKSKVKTTIEENDIVLHECSVSSDIIPDGRKEIKPEISDIMRKHKLLVKSNGPSFLPDLNNLKQHNIVKNIVLNNSNISSEETNDKKEEDKIKIISDVLILPERHDNIEHCGNQQEMEVSENEQTKSFELETNFETSTKRKRIRKRKKKTKQEEEVVVPIVKTNYDFKMRFPKASPAIHIKFSDDNESAEVDKQRTKSIEIDKNESKREDKNSHNTNEEEVNNIDTISDSNLCGDNKKINGLQEMISNNIATKEVYNMNEENKEDDVELKQIDEVYQQDKNTTKDKNQFTNKQKVWSVQEIEAYPKINALPDVGETIGFKTLVLGNNYTPQISNYIIAKVISVVESNIRVFVLQGLEEVAQPPGKFFLESEEQDADNIFEYDWESLIYRRLLY